MFNLKFHVNLQNCTHFSHDFNTNYRAKTEIFSSLSVTKMLVVVPSEATKMLLLVLSGTTIQLSHPSDTGRSFVLPLLTAVLDVKDGRLADNSSGNSFTLRTWSIFLPMDDSHKWIHYTTGLLLNQDYTFFIEIYGYLYPRNDPHMFTGFVFIRS